MYTTYKNKIISFYTRHRRMPGYAEMMRITGFRSKNAVFKLIEKMVDEGVVAKDARGKIAPTRLAWSVPLLGLVEAGFPSAAEEELLDVMNFDEFLVPNKEATYILKVKGDSMIDAGIQPGDMVVVERKATYKPGQIVIAMIDGEYTMKYLRKKQEKYFLEPANAKYKPIYPSQTFRVEAVVTAVVRKY
ncbi:MAG TPA: transcriptional repressor LexA, partial [Candidatus Paceibacterota bacterium]|nr:transcriptional repressor LexA [Candidatus Paceibacterota bacterium]